MIGIQGVKDSRGQVKISENKPMNPRILESSNPFAGNPGMLFSNEIEEEPYVKDDFQKLFMYA